MFCTAISSRTSLRPIAPMVMAPMPTAMRITLAAIPPYANHFRISSLRLVRRSVARRLTGASGASIGADAEPDCGELPRDHQRGTVGCGRGTPTRLGKFHGHRLRRTSEEGIERG